MVYEQHRKAFDRVEAFVILKDGERVATVAFKFPADGASRLYAYVHWLGLEMVRGTASGGGYDKRTAAIASAVGKMPKAEGSTVEKRLADGDAYHNFRLTLAADTGPTWDSALRDAGFTVLQAV